MLRLNLAVPPTPFADQNAIGLLAGDPAGFPNGRRLVDDVTAIELKAVAGLTIPLVDKSFTPDAAAGLLNDGTTDDNTPYGAPTMNQFPYLSNPNSGYTSRPGTPGGDLVSGAPTAVLSENPDAGQGVVVLDIGADVGALVVHAPEEMSGTELEICPAGRRRSAPEPHHDWWSAPPGAHGHAHARRPAWPHVEVLARPTPAGAAHAAVFPGLRPGNYDVWPRPDGEVLLTAEVRAAAVTEVTVQVSALTRRRSPRSTPRASR